MKLKPFHDQLLRAPCIHLKFSSVNVLNRDFVTIPNFRFDQMSVMMMMMMINMLKGTNRNTRP